MQWVGKMEERGNVKEEGERNAEEEKIGKKEGSKECYEKGDSMTKE